MARTWLDFQDIQELHSAILDRDVDVDIMNDAVDIDGYVRTSKNRSDKILNSLNYLNRDQNRALFELWLDQVVTSLPDVEEKQTAESKLQLLKSATFKHRLPQSLQKLPTAYRYVVVIVLLSGALTAAYWHRSHGNAADSGAVGQVTEGSNLSLPITLLVIGDATQPRFQEAMERLSQQEPLGVAFTNDSTLLFDGVASFIDAAADLPVLIESTSKERVCENRGLGCEDVPMFGDLNVQIDHKFKPCFSLGGGNRPTLGQVVAGLVSKKEDFPCWGVVSIQVPDAADSCPFETYYIGEPSFPDSRCISSNLMVDERLVIVGGHQHGDSVDLAGEVLSRPRAAAVLAWNICRESDQCSR